MKTFLNIQDANREIERLRKKICCTPAACTSAIYTSVDDAPEEVEVGFIYNVTITYNGVDIIQQSFGSGALIADILNVLNPAYATFSIVFSIVGGKLQAEVTDSNIACELTLTTNYFAD